VEVIAGWWFIFYRLYRPPTKARQITLLISFVVCYVFWYLIPIDKWFGPGTSLRRIMSDDIANEILWVIILLYFVLLCGDLRNSFFSALWYIGIEQNVDILRALFNRLAHQGQYVFNYPQFIVQYALIFLWAVFYYLNRRRVAGNPPVLFQLITACTPFGATIFLTRFSDTIHRAESVPLRMSLHLDGVIIGSFVLAINLVMFHLYIKLLLAMEARDFTLEVEATPPLWTAETGLSAAFVSKFSLSSRERQVVESLLQGKTYQQIADSLFISIKTVETHLRNIYQKTKTTNRFALYNLIKG
jgi:DNA-binding CsgD family transcriptional regulator